MSASDLTICLSSPGEERVRGAVPVLKRGSMRFVKVPVSAVFHCKLFDI